jgi:hypothetical protein
VILEDSTTQLQPMFSSSADDWCLGSNPKDGAAGSRLVPSALLQLRAAAVIAKQALLLLLLLLLLALLLVLRAAAVGPHLVPVVCFCHWQDGS